jgi:esterase
MPERTSDPVAALTYDELFDLMVAAAREREIPIANASRARNAEVTVDGLRLHYLDWGAPRPDAPTMLLVHGGIVTAHVWDFFSLSMRDQFHIYAVDLPGHGDSAWIPEADYSRPRLTVALRGFVEALQLPPMVLIGHSLGGSVALLLAAQLPQLVRSLVLVDTTMRARYLPPEGALLARQGRDEFPSMRAFAEHVAAFAPDRQVEQLAISMRWNTRQLANGSWTWKYDTALRRRSSSASAAHRIDPFDYQQLWDAIAKLNCRLLFLRASHHSHVSDAAASELSRLSPRVQLEVIPNTQHNVMGDNPHAFREAVSRFLG